MMAIGERTLRLAGRLADGVVLHTFFTDETLARAVRTVRRSAEEAGRDPASVRIWAVLATVEESVPEELALRKTVGRLATYLQGYGQVLVDANGWSPRRPRPVPRGPARRRLPGRLRRRRHHRAADATCATR